MSNDRVYFISRPPQEHAPSDFNEAMRWTGGNTGNLLFMEALQRQLSYAERGFGSRFDPSVVSRNYDYIAISAANWIAANNRITGYLADLIEQIDLPCLVVGLGAQSPNIDAMPRLNKGTLRFLELVSERSRSIGVRGPFTHKVLAHYGVKNIEIVGCPSYFWGLEPQIRIDKRSSANFMVAVNTSRQRKVEPNIDATRRSVERALYKFAFDHEGSFVVPQTEELEICMSLGTAVGDMPAAYVQAFKEFYDPGMNDKDLEGLRPKFKAFTSVTKWMAELSQVDFVVGTRLHGCLMGILAGTPSLLISIDSRTKELAEYFNLPTLSVQDVPLPLDVERLYEQVDFGPTLRDYPRHFTRYREFLQANGVSHNLKG